MGPILDEVVRPDMIGPARPKTDARSVIQPQTAAFRLFLGHLQPLSPPDPFNATNADLPSLTDQQGPDPAIAIAAIFRCLGNDRLCQGTFVWTTNRPFALCRSVLTENPTGPAFADSKFLADMIDAGTAASGA